MGWASQESGGATLFTELTDAFASYAGEGGKVVGIKGTEDGLEPVASAAGIDLSMANIVIVKTGVTVIGKIYPTIATAITFCKTQAPSAVNWWGIQVSGNNSENFAKPKNIAIIGIGKPRLTGQITSEGDNPSETYIYNCICTNYIGTAGKYSEAVFCEISGGTIATGALILGKFCAVTGIIAGGAGYLNFSHTDFASYNPITLDGSISTLIIENARFINTGSALNLTGGKYVNAEVGANVTINDSGSYAFYNCPQIEANFPTLTTANIKLKNSFYDGTTITLNAGGLEVINSDLDASIIYTAGSFVNRNSTWAGSESGDTASRPDYVITGSMYWDLDLDQPIWKDPASATLWSDATGADA